MPEISEFCMRRMIKINENEANELFLTRFTSFWERINLN